MFLLVFVPAAGLLFKPAHSKRMLNLLPAGRHRVIVLIVFSEPLIHRVFALFESSRPTEMVVDTETYGVNQ